VQAVSGDEERPEMGGFGEMHGDVSLRVNRAG
jgi:hypothetical protein